MDLKPQLESILFVSSKPLHTKQLSKFLQSPDDEVRAALTELQRDRQHAGIIVLEANGYWQMATNAENVETVKNFLNSDLREKLTDATVEVLAIIAYRQPISKAEIEAIRGVNSQYSIRHLLMRGLIEKVPNPHDARGSLYQVTTEFLQHLGIQSIGDLPDFEKLVDHIKLPEVPNVAAETVNPENPNEEQITVVTEEIEKSVGIVLAEAKPTGTASELDDAEEEFEDDEDDEDEDKN